MKKIWFLMLTICMACAFTACSDSDDDNPVNNPPVSGANVPSTGKVGSEIIVAGSGFSSSLTLYLESSDKTRTQLSATYTNAGATFTVPYTVAPGSYTLIVKQGNDEWTLGTITLQAADCPINAILMPEGTLVAGKEITLGGSGYEQTDKVQLQAEGGTAIEVSGLTVTAAGLNFTIPANCAEGTYTVTLVRGESSWTLGSLEVQILRRVKSLYTEVSAIIDESGSKTFGMNLEMEYDNDGKLASALATGTYLSTFFGTDELEWQFSYTGNTISTTSVTSGITLEFTIEDEHITRSTEPNPYDETEEYNLWDYDNGYLSAITNIGDPQYYEHYNLTIDRDATGNITAYNWMGDTGFSYNDDALKTIPNTIEPAQALYFLTMLTAKEDVAIGSLTGMTGNKSPQVPSTVSIEEFNWDTESIENETYPVTSSYGTDSDGNKQLTMTSEPIGTVTITYEEAN